MYLYITPKGVPAVEVPGITLEDGYIPKIGGQILALKDDDGSPLQLEPAVWFKVLVIDSINLDCSKRIVMWNSGVGVDSSELEDSLCNSYNASYSSNRSTDSLKRRKSKFRKRISESMYLGGECYGYGSDLDEAFEIAQDAVQDYLNGGNPKLKFYETILRILHCYILPSIKITPEESLKVISALQYQARMVEKIEKSIMKEHNKAGDIERAMYRQRLNFIEELSDLLNSESRPLYPSDFSNLLYTDIQKDLRHAWEGVNDLQTAVDDVKNKLTTDPSEKNQELLKECRAERDRGHQRYEKLLKVREILHGMMNCKDEASNKSIRKRSKRSKSRKSVKSNPLIDIYLGMLKEYDKAMDLILKITDQKVMILSVKEAMKQTLDEISKGEEASGVDIHSTNPTRPTDVLPPRSIPKQWKTVTEQVATILLDYSNPLHLKHDQFCCDIIEKCKSAGRATTAEVSEGASVEGGVNAKSNGAVKQISDSGCVTEVELSTSNPLTSTNNINTSEQFNRDSDLLSTSSSALYVENKIYADVNFSHDQDSNLESNTSQPGVKRDTISTIYMDYEPPLFPKDSTLMSLTDEQCSSCFGRLSLMEPSSKEDESYLPGNAAGYNEIAKSESSQDSGSMLDSVQLIQEDFGNDDPDNPVLVFDSNKNDNLQVQIDIIKGNIRNHFDEICSSLEAELQCAVSTALHRKVWCCYESHFYERTMSHLTYFYEIAYASTIKNFYDSLCELTVDDLELGGSFILLLLKDIGDSVLPLPADKACDDASKDNKNDKPKPSLTDHGEEMVEMNTFKTVDTAQALTDTYTPAILRHQMDELPPLSKSSNCETAAGIHDKSELSTTSAPQSDDGTDSRESQVVLRKSRSSQRGSAPFDPNAQKPDTTRKRLSLYFENGELDTEDNPAAAHSSDAKTSPSTIKEFNRGEMSGSNSTITSSSSSGDSKRDSGSSSENLSSKQKESGQRQSTLSEELALFTESYGLSSNRESLRSIKVFVPCTSARNSLLERSTWPLLDRTNEGDSSLLTRQSHSKNVSLPKSTEKDHLLLQDKYKEMLLDAYSCIDGFVHESSPLLKLQYLTKCLRELSEVIKQVCIDLYGDDEEASADKQLDFLVVFLCNLEAEKVGNLYVTINLLTDIIPPFMESGPFAYALVQFTMAISFLKDRILCLSRAVMTQSNC